MTLKVDRASDIDGKTETIMVNTIEELMDYSRKVGKSLIIWNEETKADYIKRWGKCSDITIYDDYIE